MNEDLLKAVRERANKAGNSCLTQDAIAQAESDLGFSLPTNLSRLYTEVSNGGFGPENGILGLLQPAEKDGAAAVALYNENMSHKNESEGDYEWQPKLLPFCHWGCSVYTCVDCESEELQLVTTTDTSITPTHWTLESWLQDWLDGVAIFDRMFGPSIVIKGINPFTKEPCEYKAPGPPVY